MNLYVGTSGYAYKQWRGAFYPEDLPEKDFLRFYSDFFRAVEINNTFYRMPRASVLDHWAGEVSAGFKFVLKAPQRLTHFQRLQNAGDSVSYLLKTARALGECLGPILFQLPPFFACNADRLREFLSILPRHCRAAFEFRHPSWFTEEIFRLMRDHRAALCIADADSDLQVPFASTTDWGYLRLRRPDYDDADLSAWARRIHQQPWRTSYVFFKHEEAGKGAHFARRFMELAKQPNVLKAA